MSAENKRYSGHGPMAWMANNAVAANLLMLLFLAGGLLVGLQVKQEVFPEFSLDMVNVTVPYPGASPEEVENGIILAIEEAVQGLEGVDEIRSTASEGSATVTIEALEDANVTRLWQEIKSEVDRIDTFPDEAEEPQVAIASRKRNVLQMALYGKADEYTLREAAERVRDELLLDPNVTQVELTGVREYEIHVEVPQATLRRYGITLKDIADTVTLASVERAGGSLKTSGGDILVRVKDRRDYAREYARLPLLTEENGSRILLEDVARVTEGFEDTDAWASYNGERAVMIEVYRVGNQTPIQVAGAAQLVLEKLNQSLPQGLQLAVLRNSSRIFEQRADLLLRNAYWGLVLVFIFLALFLDIGLAFWVSLGIPISFLGSFLFLGTLPFTINMATMFAFIVTLGIVVDDAVVVGENIHHYRQQGMSSPQAAIKGAKEVAMPVIFSVLTNMVAFFPLFFVPGFMGKIFSTIPLVVISVFGVSLIESLFVLPAHLSHQGRSRLFWPLNCLERFQKRFSRSFERFVHLRYGVFLDWVLNQRYAVVALSIAMLISTAGFLTSGRMGMVMFPKIESDYAYCNAVLPYGSPNSRLEIVEKRLIDAAEAVARENGGKALSKGVFSQVNENTINIKFFLTDADKRPISTTRVTSLWRDYVGSIPGLESIAFESDRGGPGSGKTLTVRLSHRDKNELDKAGEELAAKLAEFPIVHDIDDGSAKGKRQYDIRLRPTGERMGLTSQEVANQVRYAFQGIKAVQQQRGRNEVTVRIRLPEGERITEATLEDLVLQSPEGEVLLRDAVDMIPGRAYTSIGRTNSRRVISVTGNVRPPSQSENVLKTVKTDILPDLVRQHPGLSYSFEGHQAEIRDSLTSLFMGLGLALISIYALLAIPFKSYVQPLIIMFCIPFGIIGAVIGHILMGYSLSIMSLFGIVALSGVVVNDSLVFIDFANRRCRQGTKPADAIRDAGIQRFRPILLTTLTTFGGLAPMILETSRQARFLIPMAISLGFGILFATFITLVMIPCLYLLMEDLKALFSRFKTDEEAAAAVACDRPPVRVQTN
jgi:multidrug efflux pump subunit AcrB